ncbi:MAG TPA: hypothetical protein VGU66_18430 [Candidatus Elarobacter sp.]|nr:hypothetical protein [Candidatus Elarobacter sp.]
MDQEKRTWRAPEMIDVGDVVDVTEGMATNVRDNDTHSTTLTYSLNGNRFDEVDLE